ncbi:MAG: ligase-associated DNA damage response DEXH box helicase [Planctomycetota bacterium]
MAGGGQVPGTLCGVSAAAGGLARGRRVNPAEAWFREAIGEPFGFQRECWDAQLAGESGLLHAPTGMGKTYAALLGPLIRWCNENPEVEAWGRKVGGSERIRVLWVTPLRALAADTEWSIRRALEGIGSPGHPAEAGWPDGVGGRMPWIVERRTGDVSQTVKARQRKRLPSVLVTTPESLSLLLSYADSREKFAGLETVVVDEWHELMSTKRGTQTELGIARLRAWEPGLSVWGLSATLGNLEEAMDCLMGPRKWTTEQAGASGRPRDPRQSRGRKGAGSLVGKMIHGEEEKEVRVETLVPGDIERFPWAGHLGIRQLEPVLEQIDKAKSTLLFTNTRSQSEIWFNAIEQAKPGWAGEIALHHGSIEKKARLGVEQMLKEGMLKCVVCTSSLDLGVDFTPVEQVIQVASPKGVARLMQRAGRSGHQPGRASVVVGVPTHALELIDFAAARSAIEVRAIESRRPLELPLDVLVQHLVTLAMGGGFTKAEVLQELRGSWAYRELTEQQLDWALAFVVHGGESLRAYPQYARVVLDEKTGRYGVTDQKTAKTHRLGIGTITSDTAISLQFASGKKLGTVEESFVGYLKPGDRFVFAGHLLQLVRVQGMTATVKRSTGKKGRVPTWQGGRTPLSTQLADAVRLRLDGAARGEFEGPEMSVIRPLLELQSMWSVIPKVEELLMEHVKTRDGFHVFVYPLQGRLVHEGLGALLAYRLTQASARSVIVTVNDYGLELLSPTAFDLDEADWRGLLSTERLLEDLITCVDTSQLARRQFRDIARIAGLIVPTYPGQQRPQRHVQASSELFFDVFSEFDPENLLLGQAKREVLNQQLEVARLRRALERLDDQRLVEVAPGRLTPLGFPLWAERLREQHVSSEAWQDRITRMAASLEAAASG